MGTLDSILKFENTKEDKKKENKEENQYDVGALLNAIISRNQISMSFETLINQFNTFDFTLPKYQRKFIWEKKQITNLAVSLIKNIPIPPIYVYKEDKTKQYVILDGQQRVISLFLYYFGLFIEPNQRKFINFYEILSQKENKNKTLFEILKDMKILKGTKNPKSKSAFKETIYEIILEDEEKIDITFSKLSEETKRYLKVKYIDVVILEVTSDNKETIYSNIFKLLNSGGTPLKQQEIRNGVYKSAFYDMLHDVSNTYFKEIYIKQHSKDVELLLRFLAFDFVSELKNNEIKIREKDNQNINNTQLKILGFNGLIHILLDDFSQLGLKFTKDEIKNYENKLITFLNNCKFKSKDVKKGKHILFESIYVAYSKLENNKIIITSELLKQIYKAIFEDSELNSEKNKKSKNTTELTDITSVEKRINTAYRILKNAQN